MTLKIVSKHCFLQNLDQVPTLFSAGDVTVQVVQLSLVKYFVPFSFGFECPIL